jgi:hypothetical protein
VITLVQKKRKEGEREIDKRDTGIDYNIGEWAVVSVWVR